MRVSIPLSVVIGTLVGSMLFCLWVTISLAVLGKYNGYFCRFKAEISKEGMRIKHLLLYPFWIPLVIMNALVFIWNKSGSILKSYFKNLMNIKVGR